MFDSLQVIALFCLYMGLLFGLAQWAERRGQRGRSLINNPLAYSLSLAIYCTAWTYYGSVGLAAASGPLFLTIYLGPVLAITFWWTVLRKMVRLKTSHHLTSIADFISTRYGKSQGLAALVTVAALTGGIPYIALQIKAVTSTFGLITTPANAFSHWIGSHVGPIIVALMVVFTIVFGVRRLDPTERHEGMVMTVAVESSVKLVLFLAAGIFVVFGLADGFDKLLARLAEFPLGELVGASRAGEAPALSTWLAYLLLSASAIMFLPRQFHVAVVENKSEGHIRQAMWLVPLYMFLINLFVYPIALAGLLQGLPLGQADTFVLRLPLEAGHPWLALLVFLGGFSAATSMIMISSMTLATMLTNHLLLPCLDWFKGLGFLRRRLLQARWLAVAGYVLLGYLFETRVGESLMLVNIGLISFAAVLQFAPALIGGLFWRAGSKAGAFLGLGLGYLVWAYTSLLPPVIKSGWLPAELLQDGPLGLDFLRPERLLGVDVLDPVAHSVLWTLVFNLGGYVLGSLLWPDDQEGQRLAEEFTGALGPAVAAAGSSLGEASIDLGPKLAKIRLVLAGYFEPARAEAMAERLFAAAGLSGRSRISIVDLAGLYSEVEKSLAGSIGSAAAHQALDEAAVLTSLERKELSKVYGEMLANLRADPKELFRKIDYYQEREALVSRHAQELEGKVAELTREMERREAAEAKLRESEERYRTAIESSNDGVAIVKEGRLLFVNRMFAEIFGYPGRRELINQPLGMVVDPEDRDRVTDIALRRTEGQAAPQRYDFKGLRADGGQIYIAVSATTTTFRGEQVILAYLRDVTARRQTEDDVRRLSRRLIAAGEEERKKLAADLHDEFGQALTALHFGLEALRDDLLAGAGAPRAGCERLLALTEDLADRIRATSADLRPAMLDHLGLIPTLDWLLSEQRRRQPDLELEFQATGFKRRLSPELEIILYRVVQEGLTNVLKHARATSVRVVLTYSHPRAILMVSDNGIGFAANRRPASDGPRRGIGLLGLRERVASAGGRIDIRSQPGKGTTIRVDLPVGRS